jgi:hypothetical protein
MIRENSTPVVKELTGNFSAIPGFEDASSDSPSK